MSRMMLLSVVLYIATRLWIDGPVVDESMVELFGRAGLYFTSREVAADEGAPGITALDEA
jgi:hypothetical protein